MDRGGILCKILEAVSYTHLDVYKRQGSSNGNAYEENIVYERDASPQPLKNRFPLADTQL